MVINRNWWKTVLLFIDDVVRVRYRVRSNVITVFWNLW